MQVWDCRTWYQRDAEKVAALKAYELAGQTVDRLGREEPDPQAIVDRLLADDSLDPATVRAACNLVLCRSDARE